MSEAIISRRGYKSSGSGSQGGGSSNNGGSNPPSSGTLRTNIISSSGNFTVPNHYGNISVRIFGGGGGGYYYYGEDSHGFTDAGGGAGGGGGCRRRHGHQGPEAAGQCPHPGGPRGSWLPSLRGRAVHPDPETAVSALLGL